MASLGDYIASLGSDFMRGARMVGQGAANLPQTGLPSFDQVGEAGLQALPGALSTLVSIPKQAVRASSGLDPYGPMSTDLQRLGVPRVPAAWAGSALDVMGDPLMLSGMAARGAMSPQFQRFMKGTSGSMDLDQIYKALKTETDIDKVDELLKLVPAEDRSMARMATYSRLRSEAAGPIASVEDVIGNINEAGRIEDMMTRPSKRPKP